MIDLKIKKNLKKIEIFDCLNEDEFDLLASISKLKTYSLQNTIFYEKEKLDFIYFLINGEVKLYKIDRFNSEVFLNKLEKNSFIYTVSNMCGNSEYGAFYSVEALNDCEVLLIDVKKFKSLFLTKYEILMRILEESYKSILQLQYILNRDIVFDAMAKVAYMLSNNLDSFNKMKKHEIAYYLHIQPETLSRILKKLSRNEFIKSENGKIVICNIDKLKKIYE
jgi:CRP/FNR family transcriptional regulator